jgi:hypothetical protein
LSRIATGFCDSRSGRRDDYIYASVLRKENLYYGEQDMLRRVSRVNEAWVFGIEKGSIHEFLAKYGFEILSHLDSNDLEHRFFEDKQGNIIGRVNGTHCLVMVRKSCGLV